MEPTLEGALEENGPNHDPRNVRFYGRWEGIWVRFFLMAP